MKKTISMIIMAVIMIALIPSNVRADDMIISNQVVEDGFIEEIENVQTDNTERRSRPQSQ